MKLAAPPVLRLLVLAAALAGAGRSSAVTLTRSPSLWKASPLSILVAWQTDVASQGKVLYGTTPSLGTEATDGITAADHAVTLTELGPATRYFYRIVSGTDTLTAGGDTLHTAPTDPPPFSFLAFGGCGAADAHQYTGAARVDSLNPGLGLLL